MDSSGRKAGYEDAIAGTPEDVAALYTVGEPAGGEVRDFSASRREYRAQVRYRASQALRERELRAQAAAETAVEAAQRAESAALAAARLQDAGGNRALHVQLLQAWRRPRERRPPNGRKRRAGSRPWPVPQPLCCARSARSPRPRCRSGARLCVTRRPMCGGFNWQVLSHAIRWTVGRWTARSRFRKICIHPPHRFVRRC